MQVVLFLGRYFNFLVVLVMVLVIISKVALFFAFKTSRCRYFNIIYFNSRQIIAGGSIHQVSTGILQNALSFYFVFLVLFYVFLQLPLAP